MLPNKKRFFVTTILITVFGFFDLSSINQAYACMTGPFNAAGRHGCPGLLLMTDNNKDQASNFKYVRYYGGGGPYDKSNVDRDAGYISPGTYFMPFNEPGLEGWTPDQASQILNYWNEVLPASVTIIIPAYAHGEGEVVQTSIDAQKTLIDSINNKYNGRKWALGANVYSGTSDPKGGAATIINALNGILAQYSFINDLVITELGLLSHACVDEGSLELASWMAGTAGLMQSMNTDRINGSGRNVLATFSGFLSGNDYQVPIFYESFDNIYFEFPGRVQIPQSLIDEVMNGGLNGTSSADCKDLDGLSCLLPKVGSSDGACATCSSSSVVPNQTNIFAQLINAITGYFKTELRATLVLENFKGGIPDLNPISNLKGNAQETPLATFLLETPDLNRDGYTPPKIAVLDRMAVPGKSIEENQTEHNKLAEAESKVEIYIKGADNEPPPIQNADKRIIQAQTYASTVANNFWSTPNNQISWIAPVGYTLSEAFGSEKAQKYQQYLAEANTSYLAKNYSNGQKNLLVEKAIERKIYNNTKKYNPTALNNNNSVSLAATENLDTPACLFPERTSVKATCTELLGDINRGVEIVKDRNAGEALCDASKPSCNSNSHPMDAIVYRHFYGGNETITQGIQEPCDANCALTQNSGENLLASSGDIQLTGTSGSYRGSFNTPGFTALASTYFLAYVPPETAIEEEFLTAKSEEVPIELSSQRVGGIGSIQSNSNEEISVGGFAKNCSLKLLQALSLIPGSDEAEAYERILGKCKGTAGFSSQSYCGTAQTQIGNTSQNFVIKRDNVPDDPYYYIPGQDSNIITDPSNPYYFIDTSSSLKLKVATRFIDGATVILNHEVVPMNPGQTSAARCGGSGESPNPSWVEIQYLPLTYTGDINNQGSWDRHASKGHYTPISNSSGHPFTNTLIDLKVKAGYYKVKVIHMACFSGNTEYVNGMSQIIKLVEGSSNPDETQYCSKVTINSNMPGGGYAHPITKEPYENDQDEIMGCKLQENYNVLANNSCGGLHGGEEDDFWDKVARVTSIGIGSLEYKGYTYSKGDLRKGKEMYKRLFGREFTSQSDPSCSSYFPSTIAKADCGNLDNRDVSQSSPNTAGQGPGVSLNPPYEAQSILNPPLNGKAMYYGQGLMEEVINNRIAWGDITGAQQAKMATGYYKGYVALLRKGDIGREVYITNPTNSKVEGPFLVVDVAAQHDIASLLNRGWVVDIDYETATRWDMNGRGPTGHNGPRNVQVFGERP